MRPSVLFLIAVALVGCSPATEDSPPVEAETFAQLYAELLVVSAGDPSSNLAEAPSGASADSVLARAGVTREAYLETVRWYNEDVARWRDLLARVVTRLEQRAARADSLLRGESEQGKSASPGEGAGGEPPR